MPHFISFAASMNLEHSIKEESHERYPVHLQCLRNIKKIKYLDCQATTLIPADFSLEEISAYDCLFCLGAVKLNSDNTYVILCSAAVYTHHSCVCVAIIQIVTDE